MDIITAVTIETGKINQPVITRYQLGVVTFHLYESKKFNGQSLTRLRRQLAEKRDLDNLIRRLMDRGVLQESVAIRNPHVFTILGKDVSAPNEIACSVDPFAYVSHMSAMEWHGLTDRISKVLFVSSPEPRKWREFALRKMEKDLGGHEKFLVYRHCGMPLLSRLSIDKIGRKSVNRHSSLHLGAFKLVQDRPLRVSTVGRTFLDMIREPNLCGGVYHILEVYREHAERYLQLVVAEIDRHGTKIDKVRAGYILDERLNMHHQTTAGWVKFAQRGGSRKLSAHDSYSPRYSEKWCLSINIEE